MSTVNMAFVSIVNGVGNAAADRDASRGRPVSSRIGKSAAVAGSAVAAAIIRRRYLRWGATDAELDLLLPGDELLPTADMIATRAITVRAPADDVWPWIAQIGQGRGGFYSYDFLENLVKCDIHSAGRIHSEWQQIDVGDDVRLAPEVPLAVAAVQPRRAVVLRGAIPMGPIPTPYDFTWSFTVRPASDGSTRLVVRERYRYTRGWAAAIVQPAELLSCLMSPRMLRGIKKRAETAPLR